MGVKVELVALALCSVAVAGDFDSGFWFSQSNVILFRTSSSILEHVQ
jgi:hypothetical protein